MDHHESQPEQIIEVGEDVSIEKGGVGASKYCGESACGFSDAKTLSKEAKERSASIRKLIIAVSLCVVFMAVEVAGGIEANSLAILTDAAHLLSDVASFAISIFSLWAASWEPTSRQSYGFFRVEILGALVSIQLIWLLAGILVYEAIIRVINNTGEVNGFLMFIVAVFGLVVNIAMAVLLGHDHGHGHGHDHHGHDHDHGQKSQDVTVTTQHHEHHDHDHHDHDYEHHDHDHHDHDHEHHDHEEHAQPLLKNSSLDENNPEGKHKNEKRRSVNIQGAYLHVLGDSIQSVGVMIAGAVIWYKPEWKIIDVICTFIFSIIVLGTTIKMLRNILEVLMESTPREIDATKLDRELCEFDEVVAVHELHIWAITVGKVLLSCHIKIRPGSNTDSVLEKVVNHIKNEYNISHVTIQVEH